MENIIINVNSKFADLTKYTSSDFVYDLEQNIKNLAYIKLSSIELPITNYNFTNSQNNVSFKISYKINPDDDDSEVNEDTVTLPDGNYSSDTIILKIRQKFETINTERVKNYSVKLDINTGKITFSANSEFKLDFTSEDLGYDNLGKKLGFVNNQYENETSYTAENVINLNSPTYYFLKINNIDNIVDKKVKNAFAKIIKTTGSFTTIFEGGTDFVTKDRFFRSPINLSKLEVQIVDFNDKIIDLNGYNVSFTLEVGYIYDKKLYESINNKGIPNGDNRLKYFN